MCSPETVAGSVPGGAAPSVLQTFCSVVCVQRGKSCCAEHFPGSSERIEADDRLRSELEDQVVSVSISRYDPKVGSMRIRLPKWGLSPLRATGRFLFKDSIMRLNQKYLLFVLFVCPSGCFR